MHTLIQETETCMTLFFHFMLFEFYFYTLPLESLKYWPYPLICVCLSGLLLSIYFLSAFFSSTNPTAVAPPQHNNAEMNNYTQARPSTLSQLFFIARSFKPSSLLDPNYRRNLMNELGVSAVTPFVSHTGGAMGVPAAFSGRNEQVHHPGVSSVYDEITPSSQGNVLRDDSLRSFDNNMEEEMIEAAIEASKREVKDGYLNKQFVPDYINKLFHFE